MEKIEICEKFYDEKLVKKIPIGKWVEKFEPVKKISSKKMG